MVRRAHDVEIWTDTRALQEYSHANLRDYWAGSLAELQPFPEEGARLDIAAWFVLGVPRLHHPLATGRLTSKAGAGRHVVEEFGARWLTAEVVELTRLALDCGLSMPPRSDNGDEA